MSYRAVVAFQTSSGLYDIYYSANGACELYLADYLEEMIKTASGIRSLSQQPEHQIPFARWGNGSSNTNKIIVHNIAKPAMDPDPMYTDVPLKKIGYAVEFDTIEAVYLVREDTVETYVPVWLEPNVIQPWCEYLTVGVYPVGGGSYDPLKEAEEMFTTDPILVIDSDTFTDSSWLENIGITSIVQDNHEAIYALQRGIWETNQDNSELAPSEKEEISRGILRKRDYSLRIQNTTNDELTLSPCGRGLFIHLHTRDLKEYWRIAQKANELRFQAGVQLHEQPTIHKSDREREIENFAKGLFREYKGHIYGSLPA